MSRRPSGPLIAGIFVTLAVLACVIFYSQPAQDWIFTRHFNKEAFGKSRWGMSPAEVEKAAGGTQLVPAEGTSRYYTPTPGYEARYRLLTQKSALFLGRQANVHYVFFDDKLYAYHVTLTAHDVEDLDKLVRAYLVSNFGNTYTNITDGSPLRAIWHLREVIVNYWIVQKPISLTRTYEAVFGVVYQPLERAIPTS